MVDSAPLTIANADARRLFLDLHALSDPPLGRLTTEGCQAVVERIGFVQVDSINTVERAHHMILFTRRHGYAQTQLARLVEKTRGLFEGWTHDASLIPTRFFPYWSRRFADVRQRAATSRWWTQAGPDFPKLLEQVRARVAAEGPLLTRHFEEERQRPSGGWWDWTPSKMALEFLWRTGELAVARRDGFQKVYDLTERVIPEQHRGPAPDPEAVVDWACRSALERLGAARPGEIAGFWDLITIREAEQWCDRLTRRGDLRVVHVQGADGKTTAAFAFADIEDRLAAAAPAPDVLRVLSPFDPVIRNRQRLERLFGFDYRFEAFVPEAKRRWGYYVFPILEGDRFVGRIDMRARRDSGDLAVAALWWEPKVRSSRARLRRLEKQLDRIRRFAGVERVTWPEVKSPRNGEGHQFVAKMKA
ncbi:winged helix DNA-binding domain-containing protein [Inquilinus limosus]|uniref:winged helix-turn-helix domain-containing protein n=1 Tax=Inquilinus limosus TaxID=171674 RepID=UPI003F166383